MTSSPWSCRSTASCRAGVEAPADASAEELVELPVPTRAVQRHIDGKEVVKEVVVPGKLVNLVVR